MKRERFRALDTLRGVAAIAVVLGHINLSFSSSYILAVDFFLLLSGFVLTHSYFVRSDLTFWDFAFRRFARMYPLHLLTLIATVVIYLVYSKEIVTNSMLQHLFFVQNIGFGPKRLSYNLPSWTISVEFWVNVSTFLFVLMISQYKKNANFYFLVISIFCFLVVAYGTGHLQTHAREYKGIINSGLTRCLASFLLGMVLYNFFSRKRFDFSAKSEVAALLCFLFLIYGPLPRTLLDFVVPVLFSSIVFVFANSNKISHILGKFSYIGDISFSIYLVHFPIILLFDEVLHGFRDTTFGVGIFLFVVLAVSHMSYNYFELPVYKGLLAHSSRFRLFLSKKNFQND